MPIKIIIVGAGIAGLCTAIALRRAGHDVQIFEKSRFATEIGTAVVLASNGVLVLKDLGFDFARARACRPQSWEVLDGISLKRITIQEFGTGVEFLTVHRVDLHKELLTLAGDEENRDGHGHGEGYNPVRIQYAATVVDVNASDGRVRLEDGSTHQADLVIGADGVHSRVRVSVLPDSSRPVMTGINAFRFLLPSELLRGNPSLQEVLNSKAPGSSQFVDTKYADVERHMVWYDCRGGEVQNFVGIHPAKENENVSQSDFRTDMIKEFSHFNPFVTEMINLAQDVKCWPLLLHEPLETWKFDKVLLIGDAAHAMLPFGGQGANQAVEDAGALGVLLRDISDPTHLPSRLSLFEKVRVKRAARVQILSRVRVGKEGEVGEMLGRYMEDGMQVPDSFGARLKHDAGFNVIEECEKALALRDSVNGL